jgi:hypothetical protein
LFSGALGGMLWLLMRPDDDKQPPDGREALTARQFLEYALVLNLALVMSPLSWTHYYLLLLLPWGLYLGGRLSLPESGCTRGLMWTGILLSSLPVVIFSVRPGLADFLISRTAVSAWLFGGLCMLIAMMHGIWCTSGRRFGRRASAP